MIILSCYQFDMPDDITGAFRLIFLIISLLLFEETRSVMIFSIFQVRKILVSAEYRPFPLKFRLNFIYTFVNMLPDEYHHLSMTLW